MGEYGAEGPPWKFRQRAEVVSVAVHSMNSSPPGGDTENSIPEAHTVDCSP
jgi:hypothetical protein